MEKIIVYGLGEQFWQQKKFLENNYEIIGYSDKVKKEMDNYIYPNEIKNSQFDYVYVTSIKYYKEIKKELVELGIDEDNIISFYKWSLTNSDVREEWIIKKLKEIPEGKVILDAGAGELKYKPYCRHLKYIAQDFGEYKSDTGEGDIQFDKWDTSGNDIICDIVDIPLEDESVDVILCSEVFEHISNPVLALKEFSRLLKKGGKLLLTAPFCSLTHMAPFYFGNGFSEYWYKEHLEYFNFEIVELTKNGNYFKYLCQELFNIEGIVEKYCNQKISEEEKMTINNCIKVLSDFERRDKESSKILCFGLMVEAVKM